LDYRPKIADKIDARFVPEAPSAIKLVNVSFTYNGFTEPTLKNINFEIKPKEKVAIVGDNGAGKSTLIKLIMRLYDATEGSIYLDGINIKEYEVKPYRDSFATVFQDFQIFAAKLSENVMMDIVKDSDFLGKLENLPQDIDTPLTREFYDSGVMLSGGEAQKIAIARVFAKKSATVILDEPSSALDPISEYNMNISLMEAVKDKTVIFISHRLSTTRLADRIFMLANGEIIEEGSHEDLMKLNGKYAEMFNLQAEKYSMDEQEVS
jgi:ATP-binding cassette subfamily B protein